MKRIYDVTYETTCGERRTVTTIAAESIIDAAKRAPRICRADAKIRWEKFKRLVTVLEIGPLR